MLNIKSLEERAKKIRLLCTDVDGVLTTGTLYYHSSTTHSKSFDAKDGVGIKLLQRADIQVAFISGLYSLSTINRAADLQITDCVVGESDKKKIIEQLCKKYKLVSNEVAYVGDDLMDLSAIKSVGLACCPQDAVAEIRTASHWVVPVPGGRGVIRAIAEMILKTQGRWETALSSFV